MKINNIKRTIFCFSLLAAVSCTDNFEEINTNPEGATTAQLDQDFNSIKSLYKSTFNNLYMCEFAWQYQTQQSLQADAWSGYMITPTVFGAFNNHDYALNVDWNSNAWDNSYVNSIAYLYKAEQRTKGKYDNFYAWSLIFKVATMQRVTDMYGPAVYSKFGAEEVTYDSQEEIYSQMFKDLDFAVTELSTRINGGEKSVFTETDLSLYKGDYKQWVKYANSLRLRLAMRISKVNPTLAKAEAEKAVAHPLGVLVANADVMYIKSPIDVNVIDVMSNSWGGLYMGADMESILGGYDDARLGSYFVPSEQVPGEYKGVRTGILYTGSNYSKFSKTGNRTKLGLMTWMTTAEVYFLRAEGALRGWNMNGNAKDLYEAGISASFEQNGVPGAADYIADNIKLPKAYVDPTNAINNSPAVSKVTVAWGADKETNLEKIITQKWIATYPDGQEAWSEFRRTGYPKLFRITNNKSGGEISTELGVRRLGFSRSEFNNNKVGYASGVTKLGGLDNGATRLWWDTTGGNF